MDKIKLSNPINITIKKKTHISADSEFKNISLNIEK